MKTIFKIYIMVVRHCAWQILSSLGAELLVAMLGPIGLQVYEKQVQALEAGALEQLVLFLIIMLTVNIVAIIIENLDGLLTQKMQLEITRNFGKPVFEYIQNVPLYHNIFGKWKNCGDRDTSTAYDRLREISSILCIVASDGE